MPLVAGNWKANGNAASAAELSKVLASRTEWPCDVAVFPPSVYVPMVVNAMKETRIAVGTQNVDWHGQGAFTGEIDATMVADVGATMSLIGHSERRQLFGEDSETVARKFAACLEHHVIPVLCIGETLEERESNKTLDVVFGQLDAVLALCGENGLAEGIVAYEPVWAIGTGKTASPEQAQQVHGAIRDKLGPQGAGLRLLYGGSVKPDNARSLFAQVDIDGALVGGASLVASDFIEICLATRE